MKTPTPYWKTTQLVRALSFAGWGALTGREYQGARSTLYALVDQLPHGSGCGLATVSQISDRSGLSERWTRHRLQLLEDIGLIEWRRGAIVNGFPQPSYFKILKNRLVELIYEARAKIGDIWALRRLKTAERLSAFKGKTVLTHRQRAYARGSKTRLECFRTSERAELSTAPHPLSGGSISGNTSRLNLLTQEEERYIPTEEDKRKLYEILSPAQQLNMIQKRKSVDLTKAKRKNTVEEVKELEKRRAEFVAMLERLKNEESS